MARTRVILARLALALLPSALLAPLLLVEAQFGALQHFLLHTLTGWDVALLGLLIGSYFGRAPARWDGLAPLALALWANMPDLLYIGGTYHRDWMDVFLFHIALDEILPLALPALALLWLVLAASYAILRPGAVQMI
ncbi:MAG TPA: hypothetical protein PKK15_21620 [Kouleothrix sp.]|uniref:hypothetical protein n=1 Tax=Kouleothrix sp. TaxID=2779161 RepID=UPI002C4E332C|nr:hypothetical protein [Kouleothrix sp.]